MSDFTKIEDGHYIHLGHNSEGQPCNSSVTPAVEQGYDRFEAGNRWRCLGCGKWWSVMPEMNAEGMSALRHMQ